MTIRRGLAPILGAIVCGALAGCTVGMQPLDPARMPPLEVRAMETRIYDGQDTKLALKAVLNVLQDDGFLVDYGNSELGILHGHKSIGQTVDQHFTPAISALNSLNTPQPYSTTTTIPGNVSTVTTTSIIRMSCTPCTCA